VPKKTMVRKVRDLIGANHRIGRILGGYEKLQEAKFISKHFSDFLEPVIANSEENKAASYNIRHRVYCEELGFEEVKASNMETDDFDSFSTTCLIKHRRSKNFAGTVRLVRPKLNSDLLPIEKYCLDSIDHKTLNPSLFKREQICEISRLAVPKEFRKREMDRFSGAALGVINEETYSEEELRCFPFIAIGLYFSAAAIVIKEDIKHTYVMMEPRLARSMRFIGIHFEQIGPTVDYHGKRAPYYINPSLLYKSLKPTFKIMLNDIQRQIDTFPRG